MRSVVTVFRILEEIASRQPIGVSDLARAMKLPKSTAQRGLLVLRDLGYIRSDNTEPTEWSLTTKALAVGSCAPQLDLRDIALPAMRELRDATDENVHLAVADNDHVTLIAKLDSRKAVRTFQRVGATAPIHATSTGKAILAHWPREKVEALIARGLPAHTATTITDPQALWQTLKAARESGYAINRGEWRDDVTAVAAAILDRNRQAVAAMSVSSPFHRLPEELIPEYGRLCMTAAQSVDVATE